MLICKICKIFRKRNLVTTRDNDHLRISIKVANDSIKINDGRQSDYGLFGNINMI